MGIKTAASAEHMNITDFMLLCFYEHMEKENMKSADDPFIKHLPDNPFRADAWLSCAMVGDRAGETGDFSHQYMKTYGEGITPASPPASHAKHSRRQTLIKGQHGCRIQMLRITPQSSAIRAKRNCRAHKSQSGSQRGSQKAFVPSAQLPLWPEPARRRGNILHSAPFAAIQGKGRECFKHKLLASYDGVQIRYTGGSLTNRTLTCESRRSTWPG